jgi:glycerol-3-phosphate O-acyltransferase
MGDFVRSAHVLVDLLQASGVRLTASLARNVRGDFRESLRWLADGGLIERLVDSRGVVLHVPTEKRLSLDFYKNNIIHFFLLPSLLSRALLAGVPEDDLRADVAWWLDLYRWEFPLPERDALAAAVTRWLAHYRQAEALVGATPVRDHPLFRATEGILDPFREAYLIAVRTVAAQEEWPIAQAALTERMRRQFATALLLGEAQKPEGNSVITFGNVLSRLTELKHVTAVQRGRGGRERWLDRGPSFERLPDLLARFGM